NNQGLLATLGAVNGLPAGDYHQFRLILLDNAVADLLPAPGNRCVQAGAIGPVANNCLVVSSNSTVHPILLDSEATTGIKIPATQIAGGHFRVTGGHTTDLNLDFNACSSIVEEGNGDFRLIPVVHAGELVLASSPTPPPPPDPNPNPGPGTGTVISGTVVDQVTGAALVGGNVIVALEQKDASGIDRVIMATDADSSGNFTFSPVLAGNYDVVAVGVNGSSVAYAATLTEGVPNGTAMGKVQLVAESGTGTAPATITVSVSATNGSAGTVADVTLSALQTATTSSGNVNFTVPLAQQQEATANVETINIPSICAPNTYCDLFNLVVPAAPATTGTFAASGTIYTAGSGAARYTVEADAFVPSSGGSADCSPSTLTSSAVTVTPAVVVQLANLGFTGCQ
ncbi:MAG: DUF4382 domain-containing protein, partial [Terriglobales bacterium]